MPADLGRVALTGASGFVGRALAARLGALEPIRLGTADWRERIASANLEGAVVFHLAARVHRPGDDDETACQHDNAEKTRVLAEAAAKAGALRLVFLSSIKVNGEETRERPFRPGDAENPADPYARSKWAAERALATVAERSGLAVVVVRAPLVLGAGAGGNLRRFVRLADSPWPLPLGGIDNRRTMIQVDDLAGLLMQCAHSARAPGRTFLAGDPQAVSTTRLLGVLRASLGRPARLFSLPASVLEGGATILGRAAAMRRLTRHLEVDVSETMRSLEWSPEIGVEAGIGQMARAHREAPGP